MTLPPGRLPYMLAYSILAMTMCRHQLYDGDTSGSFTEHRVDGAWVGLPIVNYSLDDLHAQGIEEVN